MKLEKYKLEERRYWQWRGKISLLSTATAYVSGILKILTHNWMGFVPVNITKLMAISFVEKKSRETLNLMF